MIKDLQTAEQYSKQKQLVDTVRNSIFPKSNDAQLMLYFHKCQTMGVHPLDGMIHPSIYKGKDGEPDKVVFVTSIDVLRSRSADLDDGMDEAEFGEEISQEFTNNENQKDVVMVPEFCKVKVYKKGVDRPYIGTARWREFYPGEKRGHQYRQKPYLMLQKCAEAQARRLAFPKELDKLYTAEEMEATTAMLADISVKTSNKPVVSPDDVTDVSQKQNEALPGQIVQDVAIKNGTGKKGPWTKYGVKINDEFYGTFDKQLGDLALNLKGKKVQFTWKQDGQYKTLESIAAWVAPVAAQKPAETKQQEPQPSVPQVNGQEEYEAFVNSLMHQTGLNDESLNGKLLAELTIQDWRKVNPEEQSMVIDFLTDLKETAGA